MAPFELTTEQKKAIKCLEGNLQIIACAGSGKTEVVSRRIAELVKNGATPKSIVAFTFTEKAAEELKARIREILDVECPNKADLGEMYVGTIHSFCFEMLKELEPRYRSYDVLDDPRRVAFISMPHRYYASHLQALEERGKYATISRFFESYDIVRMEDIDINELSNEDFAECCRRYDNSLEEDRFLDFISMIYRLVKLIETDTNAKKVLNERIKHLVVDEYQDVDLLQEKLIRHISDGCKSLCVVGDDDQCIYNGRGSTVENIIQFSTKYPNVTQTPIACNFRSTTRLIDCAKRFIERNRRRLAKEMMPKEHQVNPSEDDDLFYRHFENEHEEFSFVANRIRSLLATDFRDKKEVPFSLSYGDFAILTRRRDEAAKIVPYLERADVPFILDAGGEIFDRPEMILCMESMAYIFGLSLNDVPMTRQRLAETYSSVFVERETEGRSRYPLADAKAFLDSLEKIREGIDHLVSESHSDYLAYGLQPYFHEILNAFGAEKFEFEQVYNYNFAVFSQSIADYESVWRRLRASEVKYFFGFISAYGASNYADTSHNDPSLIDAVKILTIHRAKGLEFPVVFLPGFVREGKPHRRETYVDEHLYDADRYEGDVEDDRRVYYTAITRSMKYLFVTGSTRRKKGNGDPYKIAFDRHPFAAELTNRTKLSTNTNIERKKSGFPKRKLSSSLFPTSFSDISCYRRCGYDYLLRGVYGYQAGVPPTFGYGTRLHNILNIVYRNYIMSKKIPQSEEIDDLFEKYFFLRYATDAIVGNAEVGGKRVIKNYIELNRQDFFRVLETEKKFELVQGDALISGQIDLLKKFDEYGNIREVEVVDFKTEKEIDRLYQADYELQLRLYAIACCRSLGLHPRQACIHHLDGNTKNYVDISEPELARATENMNQTIADIVGGNFAPNPSNSCSDCDWRKICSRKQK